MSKAGCGASRFCVDSEAAREVVTESPKDVEVFAAHDSRVGMGRSGSGTVRYSFGVVAIRAEKSVDVRFHSIVNAVGIGA